MSGTQATGAIDRFFMVNRRMSRAVERRLPAAFTRHLHITILIYGSSTSGAWRAVFWSKRENLCQTVVPLTEFARPVPVKPQNTGAFRSLMHSHGDRLSHLRNLRYF
jgi:hypothetical protein